MKFLTAYFNKNKGYAVKIELDDGKQVWASTTKAVYSFSKDKFEDGEEVKFTYTVEDGKYNVTRIEKLDKSKPSTCSVCGKELKNDKYDKCYDCFKKDSSKETVSNKTNINRYTKSSGVNESIERQAIMKASADAVATAMQGRVDNVDTLAEQIEVLYERLINKIQS